MYMVFWACEKSAPKETDGNTTTVSGIVGLDDVGNSNPSDAMSKFLWHHSRKRPARSFVTVIVNESPVPNGTLPVNPIARGPPAYVFCMGAKPEIIDVDLAPIRYGRADAKIRK